jgi:DNA-binding NarL/FixJ family response regulator
LRNVEAAARPPDGESADIVNAIKLVLAGGAIHPKDFASVEKHLAPKRPAPAIEIEKRELEFLATIEKRKGPPPAGTWAPRRRSVLDPRISDYFVVLRDPSRGERVGYRIPEDLLANIFGSDFLGTKETETGMIQGPKSMIVPFPLDLAKEYRSRMSALSIELATRCTPTSVGYVVRDASREALRERLESKFAANEKTKQKMRDFLDGRGFSDFLMTQIGMQIDALRKRYARHIKLSSTALANKLAPRHSSILRLARQAADQMIERLERERKVSFISLDELLNLSEGISRAEIEEELAER